ncbi:MAG: hypothetical protein ACJ79E_06425, partial [Anaeromyxobacteraceae bacterium]
GAAGPVAGSLGAVCVATEGACAVAAVAAAWLALRGGTSALGRRAVAAGAAAGALGGAAALELTCAAHAALPHLVVFHVGGVAVAAATAAVIYTLRERRG